MLVAGGIDFIMTIALVGSETKKQSYQTVRETLRSIRHRWNNVFPAE
jgi:hypothetical protein